MKKVTIITPVYNEENNLKLLEEKFDDLKTKLKDKSLELEVLIVNDGSIDNSDRLIKEISARKNYIKYINLIKNFGHQEAIFAGMSFADSELYGVIDSDLQQDPSLFLNMYDTLKINKCDIVQMKKKYLSYENRLKIFLSRFFYKFFKFLTRINIKPGSSDFYLITKKVRNSIISNDISVHFIRGYIHWAGFSKVYIEYSPEKRKNGVSSYSLLKQIEFGMTGIYFYSQKIALYVLILSMVLIFLSFVYFLIVIFDKFYYGTQVPGTVTLTVLSLIFGSVTIFINSILLFLIFKVFNKVLKKPFFIKKDDNLDNN